jgi:hypothetical protein
MNRQGFEVMLDSYSDVFKVQDYLTKKEGIISVKILSTDWLRIAYDENRVTAKLIVKMIGRCSKDRFGKSRNNIISMRELYA